MGKIKYENTKIEEKISFFPENFMKFHFFIHSPWYYYPLVRKCAFFIISFLNLGIGHQNKNMRSGQKNCVVYILHLI